MVKYIKIRRRKFRVSRLIGHALWDSPNDPIRTKNYPPGQHGINGYRQKSDYGSKRMELTKWMAYYGVRACQFKNAFEWAKRKSGNTIDNLVGRMEMRLDCLVWNAGLAPSIQAARQMVSHKHVEVDDRVLNIPSAIIKPGQKFSLRERSRSNSSMSRHFGNGHKISSCNHLNLVDASEFSVEVSMFPGFEDVRFPITMNPSLIVEFLSQ